MAVAVITLCLPALLPVAAFPCGILRPDNTTASKLLGTWLYVAGAAQFPRHLLEMLLIDHGRLHVEPSADGQELLVTHNVAAGDQCLTNNLTYLELTAGNTTLVKHARNGSVSTAAREEFEHHAKCLGLREEEIIYAPWKTDFCQKKDIEKENSPDREPMAAVTASPSPGTPWPGNVEN